MKRDWNVIRKILFGIIEETSEYVRSEDQEDIKEHVRILQDGGYIKCHLSDKKKAGYESVFCQLTWKGYDLLELLKDMTRLNLLEDLRYPITEELLRKYSEFELERELFEEEDEELVD